MVKREREEKGKKKKKKNLDPGVFLISQTHVFKKKKKKNFFALDERERDRKRGEIKKRTRLCLFLFFSHGRRGEREAGVEREWKQKESEKPRVATWHEADEPLPPPTFSLVSQSKGERNKKGRNQLRPKTHAFMVSSALNASARGVVTANKGACSEREAKREKAGELTAIEKEGTLPARRCLPFCYAV